MPLLHLDRARGERLSPELGRFDPPTRTWGAAAAPPAGVAAVTALEAVAWLQRDSGVPLRVPIAVIGTREPSPAQAAMARALGADLAALGLTVICGGRGGVMEAVCRGVAEGKGLSIGLLPDTTPEAANPYVTVPIATGIGVARNALLARAAYSVVAIGGGYGTLSEIAFALQFGKTVYALGDAPAVAGTRLCADIPAVLDGLSREILALPR